MDISNTATSTSQDSKLHFLDYWRIIRIRKTVIFAVFLLVVLTTTIVTYWLPKYYSSTVRVAVEKDVSDIAGLFEFRQSSTSFDPYFIQTEFEKIQSKSVLYSVITNKELNLTQKWAKRFSLTQSIDTMEAYTMLKKRIDVRQYRNTSLIEIRVLSEDKDEAALIANCIADSYREWRLEQRKQASKRGIKTLQEKYDKQKLEVDSIQQIVNDMRRTNKISDAMADNQQVATLEPETVRRFSSARVEAITSYSRMDSILQSLKAMSKEERRKGILTTYPDSSLSELFARCTTAEQELASLKKELGADNPNVQRVNNLIKEVNDQIDVKIDGIMIGLKAIVDSHKANVDLSETELRKAKEAEMDFAEKISKYVQAKMDLQSSRTILQTMKMRLTQEDVDSSITKSQIVEILDQAEPNSKAVRPNIPVNITLGIIAGLVVGIGLAFFIEYLDTSVKTIDDVERALQAPVLGVIPQNVGPLYKEGPDSPHAEAYRVLRTNLLFSRKNEKFNTITVISGGAGEGKSTTVFNLATIFAQNGDRILLVDSDLRRPSLHKMMNISNSLGLTNYLMKQKTLEEVVQASPVPGLDFLPSGKLPSSSLGILNSSRMKEFIAEVRKRYDYVFFDSPPIMGVSDASVLASEVDMTMLVVQYRKYPQIMTQRAKQMIQKVGGNLLGVVLNNINISQDSYYYYYSGYYYDYYSYGYTKRGEDSESMPDSEKAKKPEVKPGDKAPLDLKKKY